MSRKNQKHPKVAHRCFYRDEVKPESWLGTPFSQGCKSVSVIAHLTLKMTLWENNMCRVSPFTQPRF